MRLTVTQNLYEHCGITVIINSSPTRRFMENGVESIKLVQSIADYGTLLRLRLTVVQVSPFVTRQTNENDNKDIKKSCPTII